MCPEKRQIPVIQNGVKRFVWINDSNLCIFWCDPPTSKQLNGKAVFFFTCNNRGHLYRFFIFRGERKKKGFIRCEEKEGMKERACKASGKPDRTFHHRNPSNGVSDPPKVCPSLAFGAPKL